MSIGEIVIAGILGVVVLEFAGQLYFAAAMRREMAAIISLQPLIPLLQKALAPPTQPEKAVMVATGVPPDVGGGPGISMPFDVNGIGRGTFDRPVMSDEEVADLLRNRNG